MPGGDSGDDWGDGGMSKVLAIRRNLVFEGTDEHHLYVIHPLPTISEAHCAFYVNQAGHPGYDVVFREDAFDPVTRIRRGRFYSSAGGLSATSEASVYSGPFGPHIGAGGQAGWRAEHYFRPIQLGNFREGVRVEGSQVTLGKEPFATIWRVVGVERISTDEFLFTLRSVSLFGIIPEIATTIHRKDGQEIPAQSIQGALDAIVDAMHKQQPVPIVDVARETARVMVAAWLGNVAHTRDLGKALDKLPCDHNTNSEMGVLKEVADKIPCDHNTSPDKTDHEEKCVARWAASIIARLHPRGKSAEQEKQSAKGRDLRPVMDEDAECAVHLVGLLLREFKWTKS